MLVAYPPSPALPSLSCIKVGVPMDNRTVFTSLLQPDCYSFSIIPLFPHLNLKTPSQPSILSTFFVRQQRANSPVPKLGNQKSGKFNYGQTCCCSSYCAGPNKLASSGRVAFLKFIFQNSQALSQKLSAISPGSHKAKAKQWHWSWIHQLTLVLKHPAQPHPCLQTIPTSSFSGQHVSHSSAAPKPSLAFLHVENALRGIISLSPSYFAYKLQVWCIKTAANKEKTLCMHKTRYPSVFLLGPSCHPANAQSPECMHRVTAFLHPSDGHGCCCFGGSLEKHYRVVRWFVNVIKNEKRLQGRTHTY